MAVLQVTNCCDRACPSCRDAFCPICTVFDDGSEPSAPLTTEEWCDLIDQLARYGTKHIVLTGGEAMLFEGLRALICRAAHHGIAVQVHTSGLTPPPPGFPRIAFSILLTDARDLPAVARNFATQDNVTILNDGVDPGIVERSVKAVWRVQRVSAHSPTVRKGDLIATNFERFFARRLGDNCLNGKITVGYDGRVLPCFGHKGPPATNLRHGGLPAAVKALVEDYWTVPIDKVDPNRSCTGCEFRYCCPSCRFHQPAEHCTYDVDRGNWMELLSQRGRMQSEPNDAAQLPV